MEYLLITVNVVKIIIYINRMDTLCKYQENYIMFAKYSHHIWNMKTLSKEMLDNIDKVPNHYKRSLFELLNEMNTTFEEFIRYHI